jgi:predicted DCC family thiol-disulfide oxidoreductase YuxK
MKIRVYFDGLCKICSAEIQLYKNLDKNKQIDFVDICSPEFNAEKENLDPKLVHKLFHVKLSTGEILSGVEAFAEIWKVLPQNLVLKTLVKCSEIAPTRACMNLGYKAFVFMRPFLPRYKAQDCSTSPYCEVKK